MAQEFVNSKIHSGKVRLFIKPTCPYCRKTQEILCEMPFKQGLLEFVNISAISDTNAIQDYFQQLTGARMVPWVFFRKHYTDRGSDLVTMQENWELETRLWQIEALK
ncbi:glutaredoxin-1-like [Choloepus didactylus]|uniref:glutaredoxin-1-like n=1 Tax=Choloepus didactylus TaxID=27675 RepID=UPI0018A0B0CE|nr:glutaredoxin-1-like [Choloepus didactylus]